MRDLIAPAPLRRFRHLAALGALLLCLVAAPAHAQIWVESADAGDLVATAQSTAGTGPLTQIQGSLASPTDVDMYCIHVSQALAPSYALIGLNCVTIQGPNVWLFDANGYGIASNATCSGGSKQIATPVTGLPAGDYYVAVSYYGYDPQSAGGAIWLSGPPSPRAPDGPGAAGVLTGWAGTPIVQPQNPYQVYLNPGITYCSAATPTDHHSWGSLKIRYGL